VPKEKDRTLKAMANGISTMMNDKSMKTGAINKDLVNKMQNRSIYQIIAEKDHWKALIEKKKRDMEFNNTDFEDGAIRFKPANKKRLCTCKCEMMKDYKLSYKSTFK